MEATPGTPNVSAILVDIDAIQDTALGVIAHYDEDTGIRLINDQAFWHSRVIEGDGCLITPEIFDKIYAERAEHGPQVLGASPLTPIVLIIAQMLSKHGVDADARFYDSKMSVDINIWPYEMTAEVRDLYQRTAYPWFSGGPCLAVNIVRLSPEDLTPQMLQSKYSVWYTRDIRPWFKANGEKLVNYVIPLFSIIAPRILRLSPTVNLNNIPSNRRNDDLFTETSKLHQGLIDLTFLDVVNFSYIPVPEESDLKLLQESQEEDVNQVHEK